MKILEISGCNLASIKGEFRIPLDRPPFSGAGLFAIRGVTGSGKSTLIDAVCLALYDDTPRFEGTGGPEIGFAEQDDRMKGTDPRSILHKGTAYGWAQVVFNGVDGARWRARWSVTRARNRVNGRIQPQEMELENLNTFERLGGTRTEVKEHIKKKVGLDFKQFKRSVLLAQGDFAAFVKANQEQRAALLEAMTGTDIYARISIAVQQRSVQEEKNLETLNTECIALGLLSEEAINAIREKESSLGKQIEQQEKEHTETQQNLNWYTGYADLEQKYSEASKIATIAETAFREAEPRRLQLEGVERAQPLRPLYNELALRQGHRESLSANIKKYRAGLSDAEHKRTDKSSALDEAQKALRKSIEAVETAKPNLDKARELDTNIQTAISTYNQRSKDYSRLNEEALTAENEKDTIDQEVNRLRGEQERIEAELKSSESLKDLVQLWPRAQKDIADFAADQESLRTVQNKLTAFCESVGNQEQILDSLRKNLDDTKVELSDRRNESASLELQIAENPREHLDSNRKASQSSLDQFRVAQGILQRIHSLLYQFHAAENEAGAQIALKNKAREELEAASQEIPVIEAQLKEARAALDRAMAAESLENRRPQLEDGLPCPLCGSLDHPWAQGSPLVRLLETQNLEVLKLDRQRIELEQTHTRAHTQLTQAEEAENKAGKNLKDFADKIQKEETDWRDARALLLDLPEDARSPLALQQVLSHIEEQKERLADIGKQEVDLLKMEKQAEILRKKIQKIEKSKSDLDDKIGLATEELQSLELKKAALIKDVEHLEKRLTNHRESLKAVLDSDTMNELDRDPSALKTELAERVKRRQNAETYKAELNRQAAESVAKLEGLRATAAEKRGAASGAKIEQDKSEKHLEILRTERRSYFEGRSVAEKELELETNRKTCEVSEEQAQDDFLALDGALSNLNQTISTLQEQLDQAESAVDTAQQAFDDAFNRQWQDDIEFLKSCLEWSSEQIQQERVALQKIDTDHSTAKAVLNEHQKAFDKHKDSARPAQPREELESLAKTIKDALDHLKLELGGVQTDLKRYDQARRKADILNQKIQEQEARTALWKVMNDLVGSSNGNKFRNFAQSLTMEALLVFANDQLLRLTPRYRLQRVPGYELELQVIDQDMGDEIRALNSLSGGETFLVSLALALGLSSLSASDTPIESLFIDEGFGTLDPETLETALSVLDELQSQGRQVGIVSHVDGLAVHIPVQIEIKKQGGGISKVVLPTTF
jgi:exonuclease SbcC